MFKVVALLKRRNGLSAEDFRSYYENHHRRIGDKYLAGYALRYIRRYVLPIADPLSGASNEAEYDVITETWYVDRECFEQAAARLSAPAARAEIYHDEENLFDRSKHRFFTVEEFESDLSQPGDG